VLNALFFLFIGTLIPKFIFEKILETIGKAIEALKRGEQPLGWLFIHQRDFKAYIEVLEYWRGEAREKYSSSSIMTKVQTAFMISEMGGLMGDAQIPFMKEKNLYTDKAILYPSSKFLSTHDLKLEGLLERYMMGSKTNEMMELLEKQVDQNWVFNTTLMDALWTKDLDTQDVAFDPFASASHFPYNEVSNKPKNPDRLYEHMAPFFIGAAKAIKHLEGRFKVEVVLGDYAEVAEKICFDLYSEDARPKEFPVLFDRIHLSNVP